MELIRGARLEENSILCVMPSNTLIVIEDLMLDTREISYRYIDKENNLAREMISLRMVEMAHNSNELFQVKFDDEIEEAKIRLTIS